MYPLDSSNTSPNKETKGTSLLNQSESENRFKSYESKKKKPAVKQSGYYSHNYYCDSCYDDLIDEEDDDY